MSSGPLALWLAIAGMAVVTQGLRASFLLLPERIALPGLLRRSLRYVPAAVLTAIWAPELLVAEGSLNLSLDNTRLAAGLIAILVAWRLRNTFATIVAGLAALHFIEWLP